MIATSVHLFGFKCLQAVQDSLLQSTPNSSSHKPYQGRACLSQLQASLLAKQIELAGQQLLSQQQSAPKPAPEQG